MSSQRPMRRRAFLALCGASLAAGATAGVWKLAGGEEPDGGTVGRRLTAAFTDLVAARAVGRAYLDSHPGERDEGRLVGALERSNADWARVERPADVRRLARAEARRDCRAGRMAEAGGWMLSLTEARLCALATFGD